MRGPLPSLEPRPLGGTGLRVTPVCLGGGPLGSMPEVFGYEVPAPQATSVVRRFLEGPLNFVDTAAWYGEGRSEERIGAALADSGGPPERLVLSTKVEPDPTTGDYSGRQVRRSVEASLTRLGVDRVDVLHLHDPEKMPFEEATAPGGPVEELLRIKDEGLTRALGVGGGRSPTWRSSSAPVRSTSCSPTTGGRSWTAPQARSSTKRSSSGSA